jgi:hypothetical protein
VRTEKSPTARDAVGLGTAGGRPRSLVYKVSMYRAMVRTS